MVDSGLLDGREAVTHWGSADVLARRRPEVKVQPAALYVDHGDVLTSAGLDEARRLLGTTAWPVTRIATACGFTSVVTFRQNFTATYATTPTSYRQRFSASST